MGAVLHVLPTLEKTVQFMVQNQRSLHVMRVELTDLRQRIVGIKFPVTDMAIARLMLGMQEVAMVRKDSLGSPSYVDKKYQLISEKSLSWATTEKKTMKSYFGIAVSKSARKASDAERENSKRQKESISGAKTTIIPIISSFFT